MTRPLPRTAGPSRSGRRRHRTAAIAAAAIALGLPAGALATSAPGLMVVPRPAAEPGLSYFRLQARPGSLAVAGAVELRNPTSRTLRVALSAVDGATLSTLGSGYAPPGSRAHGSTGWTLLAGHLLTLAPGTGVEVPIDVAVPGGVSAGDYLSGISVEALDQQAQGLARKGVAIASSSRYAIGVEVSIPGARRPLIQFTGAGIERQPAGLTFQLHARNAGNVILQGVHGHVRITRAGHTILSRPIAAGTFVTGTSISYPVNAFAQSAPAGTRYGVSAWLRYAGGIARLDTTVTFGHHDAVIQQHYGGAPAAGPEATAWWKIAIAVAVALYALATTVLLLRRRRREPDAVAQR